MPEECEDSLSAEIIDFIEKDLGPIEFRLGKPSVSEKLMQKFVLLRNGNKDQARADVQMILTHPFNIAVYLQDLKEHLESPEVTSEIRKKVRVVKKYLESLIHWKD